MKICKLNEHLHFAYYLIIFSRIVLKKRTENKNENISKLFFEAKMKLHILCFKKYSLFTFNVAFAWLKHPMGTLWFVLQQQSHFFGSFVWRDKRWKQDIKEKQQIMTWWVDWLTVRGTGQFLVGAAVWEGLGGTACAHLVQLLYPSDQQRVAGWVLEINVICERNGQRDGEGGGEQREKRKKEKEKRQWVWWIRRQLGVISSCTPSSVNRKLQHRPPPSVDSTGVTLIHTQDI